MVSAPPAPPALPLRQAPLYTPRPGSAGTHAYLANARLNATRCPSMWTSMTAPSASMNRPKPGLAAAGPPPPAAAAAAEVVVVVAGRSGRERCSPSDRLVSMATGVATCKRTRADGLHAPAAPADAGDAGDGAISGILSVWHHSRAASCVCSRGVRCRPSSSTSTGRLGWVATCTDQRTSGCERVRRSGGVSTWCEESQASQRET